MVRVEWAAKEGRFYQSGRPLVATRHTASGVPATAALKTIFEHGIRKELNAC